MAKLAEFSTVMPNQMWTPAANTYTVKYNDLTSGSWDFARDRPATNLEWLDNRINEMRVRL